MAEALPAYPQNASVLFNLACYEAMSGRLDEALSHLEKALELDPSIAPHARDDADLDRIRDDPRFPA